MDYKPKRVAPPILAYFVALLYVLIPILLIASFLGKGGIITIVCLICVALTIVFLIFCSNFFSWVCLVSLMPYKNILKYVTHDILSVAGNNATTYTIREITSIKKVGNAYKLTGSFFIKEPMTKEKHKDSMFLRYYTDDMILRLKEFENDNLHSREN